jgi:hypothetical protein
MPSRLSELISGQPASVVKDISLVAWLRRDTDFVPSLERRDGNMANAVPVI